MSESGLGSNQNLLLDEMEALHIMDHSSGGYSTNGDMGFPCRISSPADKVDEQQIYDSVREFIESHKAAGNYEAVDHEIKNGKGIRADYMRGLVHAGIPKWLRGGSDLPSIAGISVYISEDLEVWPFYGLSIIKGDGVEHWSFHEFSEFAAKVVCTL